MRRVAMFGIGVGVAAACGDPIDTATPFDATDGGGSSPSGGDGSAPGPTDGASADVFVDPCVVPFTDDFSGGDYDVTKRWKTFGERFVPQPPSGGLPYTLLIDNSADAAGASDTYLARALPPCTRTVVKVDFQYRDDTATFELFSVTVGPPKGAPRFRLAISVHPESGTMRAERIDLTDAGIGVVEKQLSLSPGKLTVTSVSAELRRDGAIWAAREGPVDPENSDPLVLAGPSDDTLVPLELHVGLEHATGFQRLELLKIESTP